MVRWPQMLKEQKPESTDIGEEGSTYPQSSGQEKSGPQTFASMLMSKRKPKSRSEQNTSPSDASAPQSKMIAPFSRSKNTWRSGQC